MRVKGKLFNEKIAFSTEVIYTLLQKILLNNRSGVLNILKSTHVIISYDSNSYEIKGQTVSF